MNLLTNRIIFTKTGLLLLVILFFLSCKKDKNQIGLDDPNRLPTGTYFTDTITIESEVIQINDAIVTTNVSGGGNTSFLMAGAYADPLIGNVAVESFTQLKLLKEYVELPSAQADSGYLYLNYSYYYGDTLIPQTLKIHKLTDKIGSETTYLSTSGAIPYDMAEIGKIVSFTPTSDSAATLKIKIIDLDFLQDVLEASKSNYFFTKEIPGIAIIPGDNSSGSILRIDGGSLNTYMRIFYDLYNDNVARSYFLTLNKSSRKYYRVITDRSGKDLASLSDSENYDSINTSALNNKCYIQALTSVRTRISFPYLENFKVAYPNMAIIDANLLVIANTSSEATKYQPNSGLVLFRTDWEFGKWRIKRDAASNPFYVQPNDYTQSTNAVVKVTTPILGQYTIPIRSYLQEILLNKIPNNPIIISPSLVYTEANRLVFNDNSQLNTNNRLRIALYFTTTK